jgi:mannosyltransferase OCH1-like enzyme
MNIHGFNDVRHREIQTAEPQVPEQSAFEVELVTEKPKSHKSPGIDQIPAELIKAGSRTTRSEIPKLINSIWNKEQLPEAWKQSLNLFIRNVIKQTVNFI